jgi:outer membrane protein OmpA-like peptidoglycan-associated protein
VPARPRRAWPPSLGPAAAVPAPKVVVSGTVPDEATRIVEFETGNSTLTEQGQRVLDDLLPVLRTLQGRRFEIVGHTDSDGGRAQNMVLPAARAESVKAYLVQRGIPFPSSRPAAGWRRLRAAARRSRRTRC